MPTMVDARGLACPQPVVLTQKAMRDGGEVTTLVSDRDQVDNIVRLGERAGWQVRTEVRADGYAVHLAKQPLAPAPELPSEPSACGLPPAGSVVAITSDRMGRGEDELGSILIRSFIYTLTQVEPLPKTLVLYNTGVRLAVEGSPVLEDLRKLAAAGVVILVCGTCLGYFGLKERLAVGSVSNMYAIAETLLAGGNAVTI